jgi:hypothetical protein
MSSARFHVMVMIVVCEQNGVHGGFVMETPACAGDAAPVGTS